jgi:hypothetical protein
MMSRPADSKGSLKGAVMDEEVAAMRRVAEATRAHYAHHAGLKDVLGDGDLARAAFDRESQYLGWKVRITLQEWDDVNVFRSTSN